MFRRPAFSADIGALLQSGYFAFSGAIYLIYRRRWLLHHNANISQANTTTTPSA